MRINFGIYFDTHGKRGYWMIGNCMFQVKDRSSTTGGRVDAR